MAPLRNKQLLKCIANDRSLSNVTKANYVSRLEQMVKESGSKSLFSFVQNIERSLAWINAKYKENLTRRCMVVSVQALIKRSDLYRKKLRNTGSVEDFKQAGAQLSQLMAKKYANPMPTVREANAFVDFKTICRVRDSLSDHNPSKLLLAFYTMIHCVETI